MLRTATNSLWTPNYTLVVVTLFFASSRCPSPVFGFCQLSDQEMSGSLWAEFAAGAVFQPSSQREAFQHLVLQADELQEVLLYFRRKFARKVFRESDSATQDSLYPDLTFPWLLPSDDPAKLNANSPLNMTEQLHTYMSDGINTLFLHSYASFQRVSLALDLVSVELRHNGEFSSKCGPFWRLAKQTALRAVEAAYVMLRARGVVTDEDTGDQEQPQMFGRNLVPPAMRCLSIESRRNIRDWVILNDSLRITRYFGGVFHELRRENHRRRLRQRLRQHHR